MRKTLDRIVSTILPGCIVLGTAGGILKAVYDVNQQGYDLKNTVGWIATGMVVGTALGTIIYTTYFSEGRTEED